MLYFSHVRPPRSGSAIRLGHVAAAYAVQIFSNYGSGGSSALPRAAALPDKTAHLILASVVS